MKHLLILKYNVKALKISAQIVCWLIIGFSTFSIHAEAESSSIESEGRRFLKNVEQACGFKNGKRPNREECLNAKQEMRSFHVQHLSESVALQKEKYRHNMLKFQEDYERNCKAESSTPRCEGLRRLIDQYSKSLVD